MNDSPEIEPVTYSAADGIGTITLNRPDKRNAVNQAVRDGLAACLLEAEQDNGCIVVILRASGRSFCAGYDLSGSTGAPASPLEWHAYQSRSLALLLRLWEFPKPVIACVQGHAMGVGCVISLLCDLTFAAEDAVFGEPEIRFGTPSSVVALPWFVGIKRAREFLLMGDTISAQRAYELGLVNRVVPAAGLDDETRRYAMRLALVGAEALQRTKLAINRGVETAGLRDALKAGLDIISPLYATDTQTRQAFRRDATEHGVAAAVRNRNAAFREE